MSTSTNCPVARMNTIRSYLAKYKAQLWWYLSPASPISDPPPYKAPLVFIHAGALHGLPKSFISFSFIAMARLMVGICELNANLCAPNIALRCVHYYDHDMKIFIDWFIITIVTLASLNISFVWLFCTKYPVSGLDPTKLLNMSHFCLSELLHIFDSSNDDLLKKFQVLDMFLISPFMQPKNIEPINIFGVLFVYMTIMFIYT